MDILSFGLGFLVGLWGLLETVYPRDTVWFHKRWLDYFERRQRSLALFFVAVGSLLLYIVWLTNRFLSFLVLGSYLAYTGVKHLLFGGRVIEASRRSLSSSDLRRRASGVWLLVGGLGLMYLSTWF